jgi:F-type H+-transporting ATPase subunit gamma
MSSTKEIKNRIKSIKNTMKITKAMELVAASKMKRAVGKTVDSRFYRQYAEEVLARIGDVMGDSPNKFVSDGKDIDNSLPYLVILVSSNRGLCGGYNAQVFKKTLEYLRKDEDRKIEFVVVGKKGEGALRRLKQSILASFTELPDVATLMHTLPISSVAVKEFEEGRVSGVGIVFTEYMSALSQIPKIVQLLPLSPTEFHEKIETKRTHSEYLVEPAHGDILEHLVEELMHARVYQMILESVASEQSARMLAMKNATDSAGEMIDDLTLAFNKARQASITQEISEISSGMASVA